jgi:hypothetical protein
MRCCVLPAGVFLAGVFLEACSSAPEPVAKTGPIAVKDDTGMLPLAGRTGARVVPDHILDIARMPGGTLGDYDVKGRKYQLFILEAASSQKAAFLLLDVKGALQDAEYIPYMGGYYGLQGSTPVYVFAKLQYLAGVRGLKKDAADPVAIQLAARLR